MSVVLSAGAFVAGVFAIRTCFFFQVQMMEPSGEPVEGSMRGYGFFSHEVDPGIEPDYEQCIAYQPAETEMNFDDWWFQYAKYFIIIALALGALGMLIIFTTCCLAFHTHMFEKLLLWIYLLAAICQGLAFLVFGNHFCSDYICKVGPGTAMGISTFMMWLTCANTVKSTPEALPPEEIGDDEYESDDDDDMYYYDDEEKEYEYESDEEVYDVNDDRDQRRREGENNDSDEDGPERSRPQPEREASQQSVTKPEIV